jgi:hypothetical protein
LALVGRNLSSDFLTGATLLDQIRAKMDKPPGSNARRMKDSLVHSRQAFDTQRPSKEQETACYF